METGKAGRCLNFAAWLFNDNAKSIGKDNYLPSSSGGCEPDPGSDIISVMDDEKLKAYLARSRILQRKLAELEGQIHAHLSLSPLSERSDSPKRTKKAKFGSKKSMEGGRTAGAEEA